MRRGGACVSPHTRGRLSNFVFSRAVEPRGRTKVRLKVFGSPSCAPATSKGHWSFFVFSLVTMSVTPRRIGPALVVGIVIRESVTRFHTRDL